MTKANLQHLERNALRSEQAVRFVRSKGDMLEPDLQGQKALKRMREMREDAESYQTIADDLNERKVKPSRGKKWYTSSVRAVLESRMAQEVA